MKAKLKQFFDTDFHYVEVGLKREPDRVYMRSEIINNALQRAIGAIDMAQICGLDFETAEQMYEEYKARLEVARNAVSSN
jgi:hypothetical protein